jgi:hypothetical protein
MVSSRRRRWNVRAVAVAAGLLLALNIVLLAAQATTAATGKGGIQSLIGGNLVRADIGIWEHGQTVDVGLDQGVVRSVAGNSLVLVEKDGKVVQIPIAANAPVIGAPLRGLRPRMLVRVFREPSTGPAYRIEVMARLAALPSGSAGSP